MLNALHDVTTHLKAKMPSLATNVVSLDVRQFIVFSL